MDVKNKNGFNPKAASLKCTSSQHIYDNRGTNDISYCLLAPDKMHFIPCMSHTDKFNPPEAHGCSAKHLSKMAPVVGCSIDFVGPKHELCTCVHHELLRDPHPSCSSASTNYYTFLTPYADKETNSSICLDVLGVHSPDKQVRPRQFTEISTKDHIPTNKQLSKSETDDGHMMANNVRIRGKRLLCPQNATPLYGKTPSWWGDISPDCVSPLSAAKSDEQTNKRKHPETLGFNISSKPYNHELPDTSEFQTSSIEHETRRQSTAFVVNLDNSQQSSQMSLSSSLPSFQIDDHLCSYFPVSRKMSLQRREAAVRIKQSMDVTPCSDGTSDHGTYVVDLDVDDDFVENDFISMTSQDKNSKSRKKWRNYSDASETDFRLVQNLNDFKVTEDILPDNKPIKDIRIQKTEKHPKKVNRKKTFVVSSENWDNQLIAKQPDKVITFEEKLKNNTNVKTLSSNNSYSNDFDPASVEELTLRHSLDTRQLLKESSWNFEDSDTFLENMDYTIPIMKLDSPKILSKPVFENCIKTDFCNNAIDDREYSQPWKSTNLMTHDCFKLERDILEGCNNINNKTETNQVMDFDETESNMLTTRSMKTELLLKSTEEISIQLKKSKSHSKMQNAKPKVHKDEINLFMQNSMKKREDDENSYGSMDSIENAGNTSTERLGLQNCNDFISKAEDTHDSIDDMSSSVKLLNLRPKDIHNTIKCVPFEHRENVVGRSDSVVSSCTNSTIESSKSNFTDSSLGLKIVQKSRSTSSASTEKSIESFIPPHKKQTLTSHQRLTSISSTSSHKPQVKLSSNKHMKIPDVQPKNIKPYVGKSLTKERKQSSTELSIKGSSIQGRSHGKVWEWKPKYATDKTTDTSSKFKIEKGSEDISCLAGIMKYSAQIQLLSGDLLELISLRNEKKDAWSSTDHQMVDTTVASRLSTMLSTMKASNDLLFDLHNFLLTEMDRF